MKNGAPANATYDRLSIALHWSVAAAVLCLFVLGPLMTEGDWPPPTRAALFTAHKTIGVLVLFLSVFRLAWRHRHRPPPLPDFMPRWQVLAARAVHAGLYALTVLIPLSGWALVSTGPYGIRLFGVVPVPSLLLPGDWGPFFRETHEALTSLLGVLLVVHIGATILHHFVDRDDVLLRMTPKSLSGFLNRIRGL